MKLSDQRGTIIIITAFLTLSIAFLIIIATEIGRVMIVREQLQTAADSAALAAANSGTHRFVVLEITSNLGSEESTDEDGNTTCEPCGTVTVTTPPMDEQELIDEDGWREFCVPPCLCGGGGGGCEYKIMDRWLQYDIEAMVNYVSPTQVQQIRSDLTTAMQTIIPYSNRYYRHQISSTIQGANLEQLIDLLSSESSWMNTYFVRNGYWNDYCTPNYAHPRYGDNCEGRQAEARETFNSVSTKLERVINMKNAIDRISDPQYQQSAALISDDAAGIFFQANLPKHAEDSFITQVDVYNHNQRDSPYYPSVVVLAKSRIKSLFPGLFNLEHYNTNVCSQGSTYYKTPEDEGATGRNESARWSRAPEDACWE